MNFLNIPECLELPKTLKKMAETCHVQGNPCSIFQNRQKTLVKNFARIRIHNFFKNVTKRWKIWESCHVQGNPCPIFQKCLKTLTEFFQLISQKVSLRSKFKLPSPETFRTVRQGIGTGPPVKNEKLRIRKPDLPVPFEFFEKRSWFYFFIAVVWIYRSYLSMKRTIWRENDFVKVKADCQPGLKKA